MKSTMKHTWILARLAVFAILCHFCFASCATSTDDADLAQYGISEESIAAAKGAAGQDRAYRIRAGDGILIDVWRVPVLSQKVRVGLDGTFLYPLLGSVAAEGKTVDELRDYLTKELAAGYLVDPVVSVVLDAGTQGFFVVGEVKRPGAFKLEEKIDVYQAIITAGGFTDFASRNVKIIRKANEQQKVIKININRFEKEKRVDPDAEIQPGDTVVVPKRLL